MFKDLFTRIVMTIRKAEIENNLRKLIEIETKEFNTFDEALEYIKKNYKHTEKICIKDNDGKYYDARMRRHSSKGKNYETIIELHERLTHAAGIPRVPVFIEFIHIYSREDMIK